MPINVYSPSIKVEDVNKVQINTVHYKQTAQNRTVGMKWTTFYMCFTL